MIKTCHASTSLALLLQPPLSSAKHQHSATAGADPRCKAWLLISMPIDLFIDFQDIKPIQTFKSRFPSGLEICFTLYNMTIARKQANRELECTANAAHIQMSETTNPPGAWAIDRMPLYSASFLWKVIAGVAVKICPV